MNNINNYISSSSSSSSSSSVIQQNLVLRQIFQASHQAMVVDCGILLCEVPRKRHVYCPCCSDVMLRHVSRSGIYYLCRTCHQKMPDLEAVLIQHSSHQTNFPEVLAKETLPI
jgi:hypothetical protein